MQFKVLFMDSQNYNEDLSHIRYMMEKSSRFLSLSGLSGVAAGSFALAGAAAVYFILRNSGVNYGQGNFVHLHKNDVITIICVGLAVFVAALLSGYYFTSKKTKSNNESVWTKTTKRLMIDFAIPLIAGGAFCLALILRHEFVFVAPTMLIFYGLSLINASKFTLTDVKYLGYCEIILGIISSFFLGFGLIFWAIGFGILHILYGIIMHKKYR